MVSPADSIQETFGLSILEAMAHSKPVVATDWSGYRELVEDGVTGFLLRTMWTGEASRVASLLSPTASPLAVAHYLAQRTILDCGELIDKLTILAEKPGLRTTMGKAGRIRVEQHYGWKQVASKFLGLWEEQIELGRYIERKPADITLNKFSHYATAKICPTDLLARIGGPTEVEASMLSSFNFHSEAARAQVRTLLEITSIHPVSVGELRHEGFELDSILWLAKKGLRRIVSMPDNVG